MTCFETSFFFFFPSVNRVCCVYTLPFQLRWMALVRVFKAAFCTFLSYSRARAHTHTHIILKSFFSKKSTGIQKSVPPSRKKRQVKTAVVLCSLWKCQRCTQTSVGLVCSTRGEHKSCHYKKIWLLFFCFGEKLIDLLIQWNDLRAEEKSSLFTGHNTLYHLPASLNYMRRDVTGFLTHGLKSKSGKCSEASNCLIHNPSRPGTHNPRPFV